jgi:hypothetical protein
MLGATFHLARHNHAEWSVRFMIMSMPPVALTVEKITVAPVAPTELNSEEIS